LFALRLKLLTERKATSSLKEISNLQISDNDMEKSEEVSIIEPEENDVRVFMMVFEA